jgi:hypothetical protein
MLYHHQTEQDTTELQKTVLALLNHGWITPSTPLSLAQPSSLQMQQMILTLIARTDVYSMPTLLSGNAMIMVYIITGKDL